ncbi:MAG TPA: hypothetical protein VMF32_26495 [Xanthobacteraceae bacterium]|nr:hypothetical protein [Xanthobacteraceae bacterium]
MAFGAIVATDNRELLVARLEMASAADYGVVMDDLDDDLRSARQLKKGLFYKMIATACTRVAMLRKVGRASQLDRLSDAGAWTDAALALVTLEMPSWKVRRLVYENGDWLCSLSRRLNGPILLDDAAEANHEALPLAILRAFIEARRSSNLKTERAPTTHKSGSAPGLVLCCDELT